LVDAGGARDTALARAFNWIVGNYVDSTLMHLRRELDRQDGTECLLQLLLDMLDHPTVVTRTRFVASWPANTRDWLADETFSKYAGSSSAGHIDPAMIRADLTRLEEAEALRVHAERTRAHRTPEQGIDDRGMTFEELHRALVTVREVVGKYREVLGVEGEHGDAGCSAPSSTSRSRSRRLTSSLGRSSR